MIIVFVLLGFLSGCVTTAWFYNVKKVEHMDTKTYSTIRGKEYRG